MKSTRPATRGWTEPSPSRIAKENFSERFEREARAIAALNHPNICHLYDVGPNYLVMEFVEGETLSTRIQEGAIPFEDALRLARQVADALEEAHGKGIVHRDLKLGNITIKPDGTVKVLDFGLAKMGAIPSAPSEDSPTVSMAATQAGVILGTASYMSPEQARGKVVDRRADIWAFGAVLYEMLTGQRLFHGEDVSQILASVIKQEPDWDRAPAQVRKLLKCCLEKDPRKRLRDIGDAWILLEEPQPAAKKSWAGWAAAAVLLAVAIGLGLRLWRPATEAQPIQVELAPPAGVVLGQLDFATVAVSPDGRRVVFYGTGNDGKRMLWMRPLDSAAAAPLTGSEGAAGQPFWSPDSKWIAFMAGGKLQKVNIAGGPPQIICDALGPAGNAAGTWGSQGTIVFMQIGKPLQRVSESGGMPAVVFPFDAAREEWGQRDPYFLPDGKRFLYHSSGKESGIMLASVDGQMRHYLFENAHSAATYAPNPAGGGWILFVGEGQQLFARPFDAEKGDFTGEAAVVAANVPDGPSWSTSTTGFLVFPTISSFRSRLTWIGRDGKALGTLGEAGELGRPRISPDQKTVAFVKVQNQHPDIWLFDIARGVPTRFTFDSGADDFPIWSPDGGTLLFSGYRGSDVVVVERPANGIGAEKVLYQQPAKSASATATSFSKDNKWVALTEGAGNVRIVLLSRSDGKIVPYLQSESEGEGLVSPDGRWMLYTAYPSGRADVFVQPVPQDFGGPGASGKWQISPAGGSQAVWRADVKEIFYIAPDGMMMAAPVESGADFFRPGTPHPLFQTHLLNLDDFRNYDVSRDGQRFLLPEPQGDTGNSALEAMVNCPQLLKKR